MTEQAFKGNSPAVSAPNLGRVWNAQATRPGEKVISLTMSSDNSGSTDSGTGLVPPQREWASAIDLVQEAAEAVRISDERATELEAQLRNVVEQAEGEMRILQQKNSTLQVSLNQMEDRARRAEARAKDAETWLVRLYDAVFTAFGPRSKANVMDIGAQPDDNK